MLRSNEKRRSPKRKTPRRKTLRRKHAKKSRSSHKRAYLGSRWSSPYCPGLSYYQDDAPNGGKICSNPPPPIGDGSSFTIDSNGNKM